MSGHGSISGPGRQRGVALITAMLIVALAVILATQIGFDGALQQQRTATLLMQEQAFQVGLGAEAWAAYYLSEDAEADRGGGADGRPQDHLAEDWATPMPPVPIDGGQIEGQLEDMQGRFNINNLVAQGEDEDPQWRKAFERLLVLLELEPKWAAMVRDWIDADREATGFDGAEDAVYTNMNPPYRPPNVPISSTSELLALPGFGIERYNKLKPYIAALPVNTKINVCTAPGLVLDALNTTGQQEYSRDLESLARGREEHCFPTAQILANTMPPAIQGMVQEQTEYFRLTSFITIGGVEFSLYSLLYRRQNDRQARTLMRSLGAD